MSDLSTEAFLACPRRFVTRHGKPPLIWSDHSSNFVEAARELRKLYDTLQQQESEKTISEFCSSQGIVWGVGLHPRTRPSLWWNTWRQPSRVCKLTSSMLPPTWNWLFEELTTLLTQVEACLNSHSLAPLPCDDDVWKHWLQVISSQEDLLRLYLIRLSCIALCLLSIIGTYVKLFSAISGRDGLWSISLTYRSSASGIIPLGMPVIVSWEDNMIPTRWSLARITEVHPGKDGIVRVVTLKTNMGTYNWSTTKVALLLPYEHYS